MGLMAKSASLPRRWRCFYWQALCQWIVHQSERGGRFVHFWRICTTPAVGRSPGCVSLGGQRLFHRRNTLVVRNHMVPYDGLPHVSPFVIGYADFTILMVNNPCKSQCLLSISKNEAKIDHPRPCEIVTGGVHAAEHVPIIVIWKLRR